MLSGPVYMRWASPVGRDGSAYRSVYMIGVVWWWHLFARKYAVSNLLLTEILLSISIFRLAPDHVSTHNNLGTLLENNEVCPTNFKTLFLLKDKQLNPRPDSNPEPPWVGFSILQATERLVAGRARPFIEFLCETFLRTVTTSTVDGETAGLLLPYSIHVLARLPTSLSVVWRTERLFGSRARPFIEFFLKNLLAYCYDH